MYYTEIQACKSQNKQIKPLDSSQEHKQYTNWRYIFMAQQITKQTLIGEMLQMDMGIAAILMAAGMHCVGSPSSAMASLEEACMVHGMDADPVLKRINDYLANKDK